MKRTANQSQLCAVSALPDSQYGANEMGIRDSSEYQCSLDENLVTAGLTSLTKRTEKALFGRRNSGSVIEKFRWLIYLRSKISVTDYEKKIVFLLLLPHFSLAFYVLAFDYVLSQSCFLPNYFSSGFPNYGTVA
jgi:hypothetical protein